MPSIVLRDYQLQLLADLRAAAAEAGISAHAFDAALSEMRDDGRARGRGGATDAAPG